MKCNQREKLPATATPALNNQRQAVCQKVASQIARTREDIFAESARSLVSKEHMLRLALNEAESLAWQTRFPHLVFPTLAAEKVQALADWNQRQEAVRQVSRNWALAA